MIREKQRKILDSALYWVILNLGTLVLAAGVYLFKSPNNFATGGVSGISIILAKYVTPKVKWLGQTEIMLIINALLLVIGFIFLGKGCTFKTAYCSIVYSLEMQLLKLIIPLDALPLTATDALPAGQTFLEFIYAMFLTALGSAVLFNCKASSGGTDIIALIVKKYTRVNVGKALIMTDLLIASSTFFIFGIQTGLYSILGLFMKAFLVDGVIESIGRSKYVTIITSKPEVILPFITEGLHRGCTRYKAYGGYTGEEKTVLITVCKRGEALKLKLKVKTADTEAFVILTNANEILGKGFRETI